MIQAALSKWISNFDAMIIENVGNLVCPASFQLGSHKSVLIASIPEGDDKPYKYPGMYRGVDALVINKIDLLPYVPFNLDYFRKGVEILNPGLVTFQLSCKTGEGLEDWVKWIIACCWEKELIRISNNLHDWHKNTYYWYCSGSGIPTFCL